MSARNQLFQMIVFLVAVIALGACAPQVDATPTAASFSAATPTTGIPDTTPTAELPNATPTTAPPLASPTPAMKPNVELTAEAPPREFKGHTDIVWSVDFSPDGKYLATGSSDQTVRLWDLATGETVKVFSGDNGEVDQLAFSPDGKYLATADWKNGTARLWDVASGETVQVFSGHTGGVDAVAFSPDGNFIVTAGGADNTARIWDVASGETLHILVGHSDYVPRVAYSPDGKYVLTSSVDSTARLWDAVTGKEVWVFSGHSGDASSVAFSPDAKYAATGDDNTARVWKVATGQLVREFIGHQGYVNGIRFSPDGRTLLTGSADTTARLWDLATGQVLRVFSGHTADVQGVTFLPDGSLIATASSDGIARVWDLQAAPVAVSPGSVTLRLAIADQGGRPSEPYVLDFIEQVKSRSGGDITIEPQWEAGNLSQAYFETGVIQLVRSGEFELGLAGARAFYGESMTSFQALEAPFLITDDALAEAVATSDIAARMLDGLSSAGIVGLTLWPEDLRHPFSTISDKPILSPADFAGRNIRVSPSGVSEKLMEVLGGTPMFEEGDYEGAESGLLQGASLDGNPTATGNVTFFPKYQVLFANGPAFEKLSDEQRAVIREAAAATQMKAVAEHPGEADAAQAWCAGGGTIVMASDEQVGAFVKAAQPVFDWIEQDPINAELIAAIRELKAKTEPAPGAEACAP